MTKEYFHFSYIRFTEFPLKKFSKEFRKKVVKIPIKAALANRKKVVKTGSIFMGRGMGRGNAGASWRGMGRGCAGAMFKGMGKGQGYGKVDGQGLPP